VKFPASGFSAPLREAHGAEKVDAGGLVPFKTTLHSSSTLISFAPSVVAERRVKRLKVAVWASGHLHGLADNGFRPAVCWFVTLTYAEADAWRPEHVTRALQVYRNWCRSVGVACRYTWVAEIQPKRLASTGKAVVHYHLLAWLPPGVSMPQWDRSTRSRRGLRPPFWVHGMSNTQKAVAGVGYLMKYLSKLGELTRFPKGLRLYGIGGLDATGKSVRRWYNLPQWCKNEYGVGDVIRKACGLVLQDTGEVLEPAYCVQRVPSGILLHPLRALAERFHVGAYSSYPRALA